MNNSDIEYNDYVQPKEQREVLSKMLGLLVTCFENANIEYWIDGGGLLSKCRNTELFHDDDIDIAVNAKYKTKLYKVLNQFAEQYTEYMVSSDHIGIYKVFKPNMWLKNPKSGQLFGTPTIDIFLYKQTKSNIIMLESLNLRKQWPKACHLSTDLYPLQKLEFYSVKCNFPNNFKPYVNALYPNWENDIIVEVRDIDNDTGKTTKPHHILFDKHYKFVKMLN